MEEPTPSISITTEGDVLIVSFLQDELIDLQYLDQVHDTMIRLAHDRPDPKIVLDLANITYMSSTGLGMLVKLIKSVSQSGGKLCFANPCERLTEIFEAANLNKVVDICTGTEEAVAGFRDSS